MEKLNRVQFTVTFSDDTNFESHIPLNHFDGECVEFGDAPVYDYFVDEDYANRFERTLEDDNNVTTFKRTDLGAN